jgi:hypothetical protein
MDYQGSAGDRWFGLGNRQFAGIFYPDAKLKLCLYHIPEAGFHALAFESRLEDSGAAEHFTVFTALRSRFRYRSREA